MSGLASIKMKIILGLIVSILLVSMLTAQVVVIQDKEIAIEVNGGILKGSLTIGNEFDRGKEFEDRAVLFISGSGATDRDGNSLPLMKNQQCW